MQKSKLVSSLFETALTIVKYIATFSFLFSFLLPISIVTALFFFSSPVVITSVIYKNGSESMNASKGDGQRRKNNHR